MNLRCEKCDREFTDQPNEYPGKLYSHRGETVCEDCLIGLGVLPEHADSSHTRLLTEVYRRYAV